MPISELKDVPLVAIPMPKGLVVYGKEANKKLKVPKNENVITAVDCKENERIIVTVNEQGKSNTIIRPNIFEPRREVLAGYGMTNKGVGGMIQGTYEFAQYKGLALGVLGQVDSFGSWAALGTVRYAF